MLASRHSKEYSTYSLCAVSSAGQSRGLLIPRSRVRIPDGAPVRLSNARDAPRIPGVFRFWAASPDEPPPGLHILRPAGLRKAPRTRVSPALARPCAPESPKVCALAKTALVPKKSHAFYLRKYHQRKGGSDADCIDERLKRILLAFFESTGTDAQPKSPTAVVDTRFRPPSSAAQRLLGRQPPAR